MYSPADYGMKHLHTVKIPFKLISKNKHTRYLPKAYREFEEAVAHAALVVCRRPSYAMAWVVLRPHFKNKVHIDLNNTLKSLCDGLKKGGVFIDDKVIPCTVVPATYGDTQSTIEIWGMG